MKEIECRQVKIEKSYFQQMLEEALGTGSKEDEEEEDDDIQVKQEETKKEPMSE
jgi:hypothetical protein